MACTPPPPPRPPLKKTQYMIVNTGIEEETQIKDEVEAGNVGRTNINKYLGIVINEKGDLEEHLKEKPNSQSHPLPRPEQ